MLKGRSRRKLDAYNNYIIIAIVLFVIFVIGGGVFDIVEKPPAIVSTQSGGSTSISPYSDYQTLNESFVSMVLFGISFLGLVLVYRSTRVLYDRSKANLQLVMGTGLALVGIAGFYILWYLKLG